MPIPSESNINRFSAAPFIKEIGRGAQGARALSQKDAYALFQAIFAGRVDGLSLGSILLAYRIKGEAVEELKGMLDASLEVCHTIQLMPNCPTPVVIPCYNGSRKLPNLTPLLALLLAKEGIPVLLHGVVEEEGRVTTSAILHELGYPSASTCMEAGEQLAQNRLSFIPLSILSPALAQLLSYRSTMGVRNSGHTLVKILQPFKNQKALQLVNYTHPEYSKTLQDFFEQYPANVLLARGTEGEAVADARRFGKVLHLHKACVETVLESEAGTLQYLPQLPEKNDALTTAAWIKQALAGQIAIPPPILKQVQLITNLCKDRQPNESDCLHQ